MTVSFKNTLNIRMVPVDVVGGFTPRNGNTCISHLRHTVSVSVSEAASHNVTQAAKAAKWESGNFHILSVATHRRQTSATAVWKESTALFVQL